MLPYISVIAWTELRLLMICGNSPLPIVLRKSRQTCLAAYQRSLRASMRDQKVFTLNQAKCITKAFVFRSLQRWAAPHRHALPHIPRAPRIRDRRTSLSPLQHDHALPFFSASPLADRCRGFDHRACLSAARRSSYPHHGWPPWPGEICGPPSLRWASWPAGLAAQGRLAGRPAMRLRRVSRLSAPAASVPSKGRGSRGAGRKPGRLATAVFATAALAMPWRPAARSRPHIAPPPRHIGAAAHAAMPS